MANKNEKLRYDNNAELWIKVVTEQGYDEKGKFVRTQWQKAEGEVSLGSTKNPNKEIIAYRWVSKDERGKYGSVEDFLSRFFGRM